MELTWIWVAVSAIAAVLSSLWSVAQTMRARSPFARYEQWIRIRDDNPAQSSLYSYAQRRADESVVDLAAAPDAFRIRRAQWVWTAFVVLLALPILLTTLSTSLSQLSAALIGSVIAGIVIIADWRVARARERARSKFQSDGATGLEGSSVGVRHSVAVDRVPPNS